jgi:hypothetical protein
MSDWPAHEAREVPWAQAYRSGPREDRMLRSISVRLPPHIADLPLALDGRTMASMEAAAREITALDREQRAELGALGATLLRTESVASSKIERIEEPYVRARRWNPLPDSSIADTFIGTALEAGRQKDGQPLRF